MNEIKLSFTRNEVDALMQLIDSAIKHQGLLVSEAGTLLANKITEQSKTQLAVAEEDSNEIS
ncbi:hypothetical protein N9973_00555 [bacterium]|nr:hypothetical protein [bacterium]